MKLRKEEVNYSIALPEKMRRSAAVLYDAAFGELFSLAIRNREQRIALFEKAFMSEYCIVAICEDELVGIAGFHSQHGSLTGGITHRLLVSELGLIRGTRAAFILTCLERTPVEGELVMDGIAVRADQRGRGIGSQLLEELFQYAEGNAYERIRLDVIDTNPKAKKLYLRKGFETVKEDVFPYLRFWLGFGAVTTMQRFT